VHASRRQQRWEPSSASLIERHPELIPDVDIAAIVGKDLFLDEKIPRHESGQGYVRVVEHSVLWKEKEATKVFTYQGLTTCTEVDRSWTIISSAYNHVRSKRGEDERSMALFIRRQRGWWKRGVVETKLNTVNVKAWVHKECDIMDQDALRRLQGAWESPEQKDQCVVCMNDFERDYLMGT
jgi:hypothetical protein